MFELLPIWSLEENYEFCHFRFRGKTLENEFQQSSWANFWYERLDYYPPLAFKKGILEFPKNILTFFQHQVLIRCYKIQLVMDSQTKSLSSPIK